MLQHQDSEAIKSAIDYVSVTATIGAFFGYLPHVAALFTAVWALFRLLNEIHKWRTRNDPKFFNRRKGD